MFINKVGLSRISKILKSISLFIQSYAAFKSMKHKKRGLEDKFMEFCRMKMASVVDLLDLKPN